MKNCLLARLHPRKNTHDWFAHTCCLTLIFFTWIETINPSQEMFRDSNTSSKGVWMYREIETTLDIYC